MNDTRNGKRGSVKFKNLGIEMKGINFLLYVDDKKKKPFVKFIESIPEMPDFSVIENKQLLLLKKYYV